MNKKQYKLIALLLAMTMAVSSISYAANADRKVSAAAKTDNEVLTVAKKDIIRKNKTKVSSGSVIEEPEIPAKSKISFTRLGSKKVKVSWSRSAGAEKYILYKKTNSNGYKIVAKTTKLKFTDKRVVAGKRYKYYVKSARTYDGKTYASNSNAKSFRIANFVNTKHQKYSYSEMCGDIKSFKNTYSDYVSVKVVGKSNDKRNIYDVVIGNKKAKKTLLGRSEEELPRAEKNIIEKYWFAPDIAIKNEGYEVLNKYVLKLFEEIAEKGVKAKLTVRIMRV